MGIPAIYFDGKSSRAHNVELSVRDELVYICGDIERECRIAELRVSERTRHTSRAVTYPDGAYLEILDHAAFGELLDKTGQRDSLVVRMQQSWRATVAAAAATIAVLALGYLYGVPAVSMLIAKALPEKVERALGQETLAFLDKKVLAPSKLPQEQRDAIVERFQKLQVPDGRSTTYQIIFRHSGQGPNAFALPSGQIILTDEIIEMINDDDDAIQAILAHELGHLHERHITQRLIRSSLLAAGTALLFGDVSALVGALPTAMLDMKYSRDIEHEADDFAITMLKANGISSSKLAFVFEKFSEHDTDPEKETSYFSTHPSSAERIQRILKAQ